MVTMPIVWLQSVMMSHRESAPDEMKPNPTQEMQSTEAAIADETVAPSLILVSGRSFQN